MGQCQHLQDSYCVRLERPVTAQTCSLCRGTTWFAPQIVARREFRRVRLLSRAEEGAMQCPRYGIRVDERFCAECLRNGYLRQLLFRSCVLSTKRRLVCEHRGRESGAVERECCGGKTRSFRAYECSGKQQTIVPEFDCVRCLSFSHPTLQRLRDDQHAPGGRPACVATLRRESRDRDEQVGQFRGSDPDRSSG